jgi:hypothetical protein
MSLYVHTPTAAQRLQLAIVSVFGARDAKAKKGKSSQKPTVAAGYLKSGGRLLIARQGGPIAAELGNALQSFVSAHAWADARDLVSSKLNKGEWTSYHAEMMIVSGLLAELAIKAPTTDSAKAKVTLAGAGGFVVSANAPCCKHCTGMLTKLGAEFETASDDAGLTGWWNPFLDRAFPQADKEFQKTVPGE